MSYSGQVPGAGGENKDRPRFPIGEATNHQRETSSLKRAIKKEGEPKFTPPIELTPPVVKSHTEPRGDI